MMMAVDDRPVMRKAGTYWDFMSIFMHPAFRLGFNDAMAGRPLDHEKILDRIASETPASALERLKWDVSQDIFVEVRAKKAALAQFRYEEGRQAVLERGMRAKSWNHPDFPPAACRKYAELKDLHYRQEQAVMEFWNGASEANETSQAALPLQRAEAA